MWDKTINRGSTTCSPCAKTADVVWRATACAAAEVPVGDARCPRPQDARRRARPTLHPRIIRGELVRKAFRLQRTPHVGIITLFEYAIPEEPLELSFPIPSVKHAARWEVTIFQDLIVDDARDDGRFGVMDTRRGRREEAIQARVRGEIQHLGGGAPGLLCRSVDALPFCGCSASFGNLALAFGKRSFGNFALAFGNLALARSRGRSLREKRLCAAAREVPFLLRPSRIMLMRGRMSALLSSHGFAAARVAL